MPGRGAASHEHEDEPQSQKEGEVRSSRGRVLRRSARQQDSETVSQIRKPKTTKAPAATKNARGAKKSTKTYKSAETIVEEVCVKLLSIFCMLSDLHVTA